MRELIFGATLASSAAQMVARAVYGQTAIVSYVPVVAQRGKPAGRCYLIHLADQLEPRRMKIFSVIELEGVRQVGERSVDSYAIEHLIGQDLYRESADLVMWNPGSRLSHGTTMG